MMTMKNQTKQQSGINEAIQNAYPQEQSKQTFYTVEQFSIEEPSFSTSSLRNYIFKSVPRISAKGIVPGNGLIECGAIVRIGRKILINEEKFLAWVESQQKSGGV
jgi:hypothetical protein